MPELIEFLSGYETASEAVKGGMTPDLVALGHEKGNLVRMRADANATKGKVARANKRSRMSRRKIWL
jgi:hypothetical protein